MDKLRKIASWCWETKERIVLAVMVILLGYRVYSLVYTPANDDPERMPGNPTTTYSEALVIPPPVPPLYDMDPVIRLIRKDLFHYEPPRAGGRSQTSGSEEEGEIRVLRIIPAGNDTYKAQITTGASRDLIREGEKFESYQLMSIDPDTGCCEIYSESLGKLIEVCVEEN